MIPTHETDHKQTGRDLFTSQFKGRKNIQGFWDAFARQLQQVEDALWDTLEQRALDVAVGTQLDVLGALVGQERLEYDDDNYRHAIRLRIRANRSKGKAEDVIDVMRLAYPDAVRRYLEWYPAGFVVRALDVDGVRAVAAILRDTRPPGVRAIFEYTEWTTDSIVLGWSGGAVAGQHGLGYDTGTTRGLVAGAVEV